MQQRKAIKIELGVKDSIFKFCFSYILAVQTLGLSRPMCIGGRSQKNHHSGSGHPVFAALEQDFLPLATKLFPKLVRTCKPSAINKMMQFC